MKTFLVLFSLVASSAYASDKILLNCNLSQGDDQQVTVLEKSDGLQLKELNTRGEFLYRPLSTKEWKSQRIRLTTDPFFGKARYEIYFSQEDNAWRFIYESDGFRALGFAHCF